MPFQKGFLVNWDIEKQIWDYIFGKEVMKVNLFVTNHNSKMINNYRYTLRLIQLIAVYNEYYTDRR